MNGCERTFSAIASHPPQQKAIAHFSKTNPIALRTNHSMIASLLPQEKPIAHFSTPDCSREKESATGSHC
jgi:hypothetical protein